MTDDQLNNLSNDLFVEISSNLDAFFMANELKTPDDVFLTMTIFLEKLMIYFLLSSFIKNTPIEEYERYINNFSTQIKSLLHTHLRASLND